MASGNPQTLASTLERPDSFEDWLLGTHYSQKYLASMRLQGHSSPVPPIGQPKGIQAVKRKQHSRGPQHDIPHRSNVSANNGVRSMGKRQKHSEARTIQQETGEMTPPGVVMSTGKKNGVSLGTTEAYLDEPLDEIEIWNLLRDSYCRIKDSCSGVFPPLLTPYTRPLWTYKTVNAKKNELSIDTRTKGENHDLSAPSSFKKSHDILDIPLHQRFATARQHPSTGPPCFAPTPTSYRWLMTMH
ncbi:hypothetical protein TraAM80_04661 [Trypanosoma rangeli]|uniref:Uncharacterized protein n=1 Tax=Trypanosoma rangeli TaxID=5698 RepID=A0A3R7NNH6_TRYRA|nr:uncharacterized protein TraAM80_04661 [Trypanosoma rangeli]RNF05250.1 hypothetical protein TraAM80_04661 [Trypanosoma rangeli]|eukprot:RNF05250.1 hypothetical protein TraAM80_04661 [Trypanosoma rangeli]